MFHLFLKTISTIFVNMTSDALGRFEMQVTSELPVNMAGDGPGVCWRK